MLSIYHIFGCSKIIAVMNDLHSCVGALALIMILSLTSVCWTNAFPGGEPMCPVGDTKTPGAHAHCEGSIGGVPYNKNCKGTCDPSNAQCCMDTGTHGIYAANGCCHVGTECCAQKARDEDGSVYFTNEGCCPPGTCCGGYGCAVGGRNCCDGMVDPYGSWGGSPYTTNFLCDDGQTCCGDKYSVSDISMDTNPHVTTRNASYHSATVAAILKSTKRSNDKFGGVCCNHTETCHHYTSKGPGATTMSVGVCCPNNTKFCDGSCCVACCGNKCCSAALGCCADDDGDLQCCNASSCKANKEHSAAHPTQCLNPSQTWSTETIMVVAFVSGGVIVMAGTVTSIIFWSMRHRKKTNSDLTESMLHAKPPASPSTSSPSSSDMSVTKKGIFFAEIVCYVAAMLLLLAASVGCGVYEKNFSHNVSLWQEANDGCNQVGGDGAREVVVEAMG